MDVLLISACVGIASLLIERAFKYTRKRSSWKSSCCDGQGLHIEHSSSIQKNNDDK